MVHGEQITVRPVKNFLSESVFDDFNTVVLLVSVALILDGMNSCTPVAVLCTPCLVDFNLQCRSELVTSIHLGKKSKDKLGPLLDK